MSYLTVVGPTCSGKTRLAERLAEPNGELINLDSFQMYSFFRLGTGRSDRKTGHLYGILDPHQEVSTELYLDSVEHVLGSMASRNVQPVFEGGSLTLLEALASRFSLRVVGIRPDPSQSIDTLVTNRVSAVGQKNLIEEAQEGLQRGYRDTIVMRDNVVYLPLVHYLDGACTQDEAFEMIHTSLASMHERQMAAYSATPGIEWADSYEQREILTSNHKGL